MAAAPSRTDSPSDPGGLARLKAGPGFLFGERWVRLRNRLLADPRFHRFASGFPLTAWVARKRSREVFDLAAGFVYSQVLLACLKLEVFEALAGPAEETATLARRFDLSMSATRRLLEAAAALRLVQKMGPDLWSLGDLGAALKGNPGGLAMIAHHPMLYTDLADPVALLRGETRPTELERFWAYATAEDRDGLNTSATDAYTRLMADSQSLIADDILDAYPVGQHQRLLDVGGGEGVFLAAALTRAGGLKGTVFDLPSVVARAGERLEGAGLAGRADTVGGDFTADSLPEGHDLISLVRIVHDHDDEVVAGLLARVRAALPEGGTLLLAEPMAGTPGAEAMGAAYFGFYLWAMGSGRPRTPEELTAMLRRAGFATVTPLKTRRPLLTSLLVARP